MHVAIYDYVDTGKVYTRQDMTRMPLAIVFMDPLITAKRGEQIGSCYHYT